MKNFIKTIVVLFLLIGYTNSNMFAAAGVAIEEVAGPEEEARELAASKDPYKPFIAGLEPDDVRADLAWYEVIIKKASEGKEFTSEEKYFRDRIEQRFAELAETQLSQTPDGNERNVTPLPWIDRFFCNEMKRLQNYERELEFKSRKNVPQPIKKSKLIPRIGVGLGLGMLGISVYLFKKAKKTLLKEKIQAILSDTALTPEQKDEQITKAQKFVTMYSPTLWEALGFSGIIGGLLIATAQCIK